TTPGIDAASGEYSDFGIPATILANYLRENGIVPEKCDLNSLLTTPGIDAASGEYSDFGIPATILANYLRENGIVPEKCDL
ncbi:hypothetical protein, partial [Pantoea agglomerans]|uniref:hypothetical protein n=1 Tax=Enterobacter agglomerans TaxID=549 RepID=UPI001A90A0C0